MESQSLAPDDPQRIGGYLLAGRLGVGGQGVVYDAYDEAGGRVAIKALHPGAAGNGQARARLAKEVTAATRVASFCTARIVGADLEADRPYIVSEFVAGPSLRQAVEDSGPLGQDAVHRLAVAVATALAAVHAVGVVHRDLKPDNVLLGPDGPRVIDFGIARTEEMTLSATGAMIGTPKYMAPEALNGGRAGPAADVFAWGAVVLYAATGHDPFHAQSAGAAMYRVLTSEPDVSVLPEPLRGLVFAALAKEPEGRPAARDLLLGLLGHATLDEGVQVAADLRPAGPVGAPTLGRLAEEVFARLSPQEQRQVPEVLLRLVSADGHGVRSADRGEFGPGAERVITVLSEAGLLGVSPKDVRITRPGLLPAWPRLREWVEVERPGLGVHAELREAARRWDRRGHRDTDLFHGPPLEQAMQWAATGRRHLKLNDTETEFLAAAAALTRRRARTRRAVTGVLAGLLAVTLVAVALAESRRMELARSLEQAEARRLAAYADDLRQGDPVTAMRLSVAAWRLSDVRETRAALFSSLVQQEVGALDPPEPGARYALGPGGATLVGVGKDAIQVWDAVTGRRLRTIEAPGLGALGVSASARHAAVNTPKGVTLWDLATGARLPGAFGAAGDSARLGPAGKVLVSSSKTEHVIREVATGRVVLRVPDTPGLYQVEIGGDDRYAATTVQGGGPVHLWDLRTGREMPVPAAGHAVTDVAVSRDGRVLALNGGGSTSFWNPRTGRLIARSVDTTVDGNVVLSPDGRLAAVLGPYGLEVMRVAGGLSVLRRGPAVPDSENLRFTADGRTVRYADPAGRVVSMDVATFAGGRPVDGGLLLGAAFSPGGDLVAVQRRVEGERAVELWDVAGRRRLRRVEVPGPEQEGYQKNALAFSPDGRTLAIGPGDVPAVTLWDLTTMRRVRELRWEAGGTYTLAFTPDGRRLAVAGTEGGRNAVRIWDVASGRPGRPLGVDAQVVAFGPGGDRLAYGGTRNGLLSLADGAARDVPGMEGATAAAFAPRGGSLAVGDGQGRVRLWDAASGTPRGPVADAHVSEVGRVVFSPDGSLLATTGDSVRLWDAGTGQGFGLADLGVSGVLDLAFTPGGRSLRVIGWDGAIVERPLGPAALSAVVCRRAGGGLPPDAWRRYLSPEVPYRATC
ncbi:MULTISPECIES: serine/threonine-protein kinase [Streptosporangium]|uniref:WD40 repeat protein n=1 Tax=Streptosporangium brasiliense TaxID=47480 RepID=A0ABT9QZK4_9ACTN|nr:serine/threonine-protein kinase [Streptosporangium brasiliense]MDP9861640.1 WD40 repeat protein [Streptosporangium brasiliense]